MRRLVQQFLKKRDGVMAVEFAFVAPVMLGIFFGLTELALALGIHADVINLSSVGADLVAQESTPTTADLTNVFSALSAMLYPYSTTPAQITISSVIDNSSGSSAGAADPTGKVAWSCTKGGTARTTGSTYSFPTAAQGVITSGGSGSVIMTEVSYTYTLPITINLPGLISLSGPYPMTSVFYSKPRRLAQIPTPGTCPP